MAKFDRFIVWLTDKMWAWLLARGWVSDDPYYGEVDRELEDKGL